MWVSGTHSLQPGDAFTSHPDAVCREVLGLSDPLAESIQEDDAAEERLLRQLKKAQATQEAKDAHQRGLIDLSIVTPLFGFVPPPEASSEPMTQAQKNILERFQIFAPSTLPMEHAQYIIQKMNERQRLQLATVRQVKRLRQFGHKNAHRYTFEMASKAIGTDWRVAGRTRAVRLFNR